MKINYTRLRRLLTVVLAAYFFFLTMGQDVNTFAPQDAENLRLGVALMADVHTEANNLTRFNVEAKAFKNLNGGKNWLDALVLLGDNTMNGGFLEYGFLYGMLEYVNPIRPYYPICGNHDLGNSETADYEKLNNRFIGYLQTFVDENIQTAYYAKEINGYRMIFLAHEKVKEDDRWITDAQLDFLETELNAAKETGKPVFVFNHCPSHYVKDEGRARFLELMNSYDKIFYLVGHMHYYYRFTTVEGSMHTPEIWIPNVTELEDGEMIEDTGRGYLMEVYDESVVFRAYNYYTGSFIEGHEKTYPLVQAEPIPSLPIDFSGLTA